MIVRPFAGADSMTLYPAGSFFNAAIYAPKNFVCVYLLSAIVIPPDPVLLFSCIRGVPIVCFYGSAHFDSGIFRYSAVGKCIVKVVPLPGAL